MQSAQIEKRRHREYWETIKRVHAKLDVKIQEQRFLEALQEKLHQEREFAQEREKKKL